MSCTIWALMNLVLHSVGWWQWWKTPNRGKIKYKNLTRKIRVFFNIMKLKTKTKLALAPALNSVVCCKPWCAERCSMWQIPATFKSYQAPYQEDAWHENSIDHFKSETMSSKETVMQAVIQFFQSRFSQRAGHFCYFCTGFRPSTIWSWLAWHHKSMSVRNLLPKHCSYTNRCLDVCLGSFPLFFPSLPKHSPAPRLHFTHIKPNQRKGWHFQTSSHFFISFSPHDVLPLLFFPVQLI